MQGSLRTIGRNEDFDSAILQARPLVRGRRSSNSASLYEGAGSTRRTAGWQAPTASANQGLLSGLTTLRDRSRAAVRNDGYAKGVIDKLVTNIVGTGIKPLSRAQDPEFRKAVQALWLRWTDECDADGLLDWYGLQSLAVRTWLEGGDAFVRLRPRLPKDGLSVPLQLQVVEPELVPHTHTVWGQRIRAGIEFDALGRRAAYWFHPSRPEQDDFDASQLRRVPAENVVHLYDPLRAGQLRGLPHLTQALISLYELDKYDDATLLRQQLANMFVGFVKTPQSTGTAETLHPLTGEETETSVDDKPMLSLEPGAFQELAPGEEVEFSDPPEANGYPDFMRQQLFGVSAATGVPYEVLTGDMRGVNDRTVRLVLHEFRRRIQGYQAHVVTYQLNRAVWRTWMDLVFLTRALPIPAAYVDDRTPWLACEWKAQGWPYMHPVQDVQAEKLAIRAGLTSRSAAVSERGEDAEVIDAEQAADNTRADELGLVYDSDPRKVSGAGLTQARPAGSELPTDDNLESA